MRVVEAAAVIQEYGYKIHQTADCVWCGYDTMMVEPNKFMGHLECPNCKGFTSLLKEGCGFVVVCLGDETTDA